MGRSPMTPGAIIAIVALFCAIASQAMAQPQDQGGYSAPADTPDPATDEQSPALPPPTPDPGGWRLVLAPDLSVGVVHLGVGLVGPEDAYMGVVGATLLLRHSALAGGLPSSILYGLRGSYGLGGGPGARQAWDIAILLGWRASHDRVLGGLGLSYEEYDEAGKAWVSRGAGLPLWLEVKLGENTSNWLLRLEGAPSLMWRDGLAPSFAFGLNVGVAYHFPIY